MVSFCTENLNSMLDYMIGTVVPPKPPNFSTESLISPATESSGAGSSQLSPTPHPLGVALVPGYIQSLLHFGV